MSKFQFPVSNFIAQVSILTFFNFLNNFQGTVPRFTCFGLWDTLRFPISFFHWSLHFQVSFEFFHENQFPSVSFRFVIFHFRISSMSNFEFVQIDPEFSLMRPSHPFFLDHVHRKCSTCFHLHPSTTFPFRISIISVHFPLLFLVSLTVVAHSWWTHPYHVILSARQIIHPSCVSCPK